MGSYQQEVAEHGARTRQDVRILLFAVTYGPSSRCESTSGSQFVTPGLALYLSCDPLVTTNKAFELEHAKQNSTAVGYTDE